MGTQLTVNPKIQGITARNISNEPEKKSAAIIFTSAVKISSDPDHPIAAPLFPIPPHNKYKYIIT